MASGAHEKPSSMMALTLWQPWASLVALGVKRYETRSWRTSYRGRLAIHAAKRVVPVDGYAGALIAARLAEAGLRLASLPLGAVVATCTLVDCYPVESLWVELVDMGDERAFGDWSIGRYAWQLADVVPLEEPIPARGKQRLWVWSPPADAGCC